MDWNITTPHTQLVQFKIASENGELLCLFFLLYEVKAYTSCKQIEALEMSLFQRIVKIS